MDMEPPPRPDAIGAPTSSRPRFVLTYALIAALAWVAGGLVAWRSLGWYPPPAARPVLFFGWPPVVVLGLLLNRVDAANGRRSLATALALAAFLIPSAAALVVPGVKQPTQYPIPGRPWFALAAAPEGSFDLYLMKGDADHLVAYGETPWTEQYAVLSPDRRHIVYPANRYGSFDLFVADLDSAGEIVGTRRLTDDPRGEVQADWSPDGSRVVYVEAAQGSSGTLQIVDAEGGEPTQLTSQSPAAGPGWSPDGRHIAFAAPNVNDPDDFDIWVMRADGSHARDVIQVGPNDWGPRWSPDGSKLAFTSGFAPEYDAYVAGADGSGARLLTPDTPGEDFVVDWTPDGSRILFASDRSGTGGKLIYMMNGDGTDVQLVLRI
jgi:dipeptidyl aminopeptidase/acylaminoacyl peptidase